MSRTKPQDARIAKFLLDEGFDLEHVSNVLNHKHEAFFEVKDGKLLRDNEVIWQPDIKWAELYGGLKAVLTTQKRWVRQTKGLGYCQITELTKNEARNIELVYPRQLLKMTKDGVVFKMEFFGPAGLKPV
jgi:hypothetical protein